MKNINFVIFVYNLLFAVDFIADNNFFKDQSNDSYFDGNRKDVNACLPDLDMKSGLNKYSTPDKNIGAISILDGEYFSEINKNTIEFFESILKNMHSKDGKRLSFNKNISKEEYDEKCSKFKNALYYFTQNMKKLNGYVLCVNFDNISFKLRKREDVIAHIYDLKTSIEQFNTDTLDEVSE